MHCDPRPRNGPHHTEATPIRLPCKQQGFDPTRLGYYPPMRTQRPLILATLLALSACATAPRSPEAPVATTPAVAAAAPGTNWRAIESDFRTRTADASAQIEGLPDGGLRITIAAGTGFDSGKSHLKPALARTLAGIADGLAAHPTLHAHIVGHTDSVGREGYNMLLSRQRARAVRNHLIALGGIDAARLSAEGKGEREPRVDNDTPENRRLNRRVEIRITAPQ